MSAAPPPFVSFGSCQNRKLFPGHFAPNRLGNQMFREEAPQRGPGCYEQQFGTIVYELQHRPESKRGYVVSARTAARFLPCSKTTTPSPQKYQQDQSRSRVPPPGRTPFGSTTQRFQSRTSTADQSPGPGRFSLDVETNRKVSWPMCFGRPDWTRLPQLEQRSLRVKLSGEKELLKQRSRVAYLSLYY